MDTVFIRGLVVETVIGCYDHEKVKTQQIILDVEMAWDISKAADSDSLEDTIDYDAVRLRIEKLCSDERFELVESLAEKITTVIMAEFDISGMRLRISKPEAIPNTLDVGVRIARGLPF